MKRERNHEGYHDPTACRAVEKWDEKVPERPRSGFYNTGPLTYQMAESEGFQRARAAIK